MAKHQTGDKDSTQASGHSGRVGQALGEQPFLPLGPLQSKGLLWVLVLTCGLCPLCRLADWCQALAAAVLHPSHAFPLQALMQNEAFDSTDTMMWQQALLAIAALRYLFPEPGQARASHGPGSTRHFLSWWHGLWASALPPLSPSVGQAGWQWVLQGSPTPLGFSSEGRGRRWKGLQGPLARAALCP